jgi:hypothetical protein
MVMLRTRFVFRLALLACAWFALPGSRAFAQGGIEIDAEGVVRPAFGKGKGAALSKKQREAFAADNLSQDVQAFSELRKVSLVRLEQAYEALVDGGRDVPEEVQYLAGLQRIEYVFVDPPGRDVVLAGPAEGFSPDGAGAVGRRVGLTTGRPAIRLDDLIVALRSVWQRRGGGGVLGCSIDPKQDRIAALQNYLRQNSAATTSSGAKQRYREMARVLGLQNISVQGVPDDSHFAQALVEADYRMKRISLGVEPSGVRGIPSYLSLITPNGNSIQRWWFLPVYEAIQANDEGTAYQLSGPRAQLVAQEEWTDARGRRSDAAFTRASTQKFAQLFTEHFEELAAASPVFAEMQNLFDLAVTAALLRKTQAAERAQWRAAVFLDPQRAPVEELPVPRQVQSEQMTRPAKNGTMLGLVGGVTLDPFEVVSKIEAAGAGAAKGEVEGVRARAIVGAEKTEGRWWWD